MSIPIIMFHYGYTPHLVMALAQAKATNPTSDVILLGDQSNQFLDFVQHESIDRYCTEAKQFEQIYAPKHRSPNPYQYELFCFQRWLILKEFMNARGLKHCVHIDSDVLLYTDLSAEQHKFDRFEFTTCKGSGHTSFLKISGLEKFCQLLFATYTDESLFKEVENIVQVRNENLKIPIGISDMMLLVLFYEKYREVIGLTSDVIDGSVYDTRITHDQGFEMQDGMKYIRWVNGQPVGKHLELGQDIRFNSLHFQGESKRKIGQYFTGNQAQAFFYKAQGSLRHKMKRLAY